MDEGSVGLLERPVEVQNQGPTKEQAHQIATDIIGDDNISRFPLPDISRVQAYLVEEFKTQDNQIRKLVDLQTEKGDSGNERGTMILEKGDDMFETYTYDVQGVKMFKYAPETQQIEHHGYSELRTREDLLNHIKSQFSDTEELQQT